MAMKAILFYNFAWLIGGVERFTTITANNLCGEYDVHIAVKASPAASFTDLDPRVKIISFNSSDLWIEESLSYIEVTGVNLVILNSGINPDAVELYKALERKGLKTIVCNHEYYFYPMRNQLFDCAINRIKIMNTAAACSLLTSFSEKMYRCFNDNGIVMPNPLGYSINSNYLRDKPVGVIAAVGRWDDPNKRVDRVLRAFSSIVKVMPTVRLVLAGPINVDVSIPENGDRTVRQLIEYLGISENNMDILGSVDNTEVETIFASADVSLLTSETEGFALVLTEAQALGVPAVICRVPGLEDIITDGVNGFIVEQDDVEGMAQRVVQILSDDELYSTMRNASLKMAQRFEQTRIAARWKKLIEMILNAKNESDIREGRKAFQSPMKFSTEDVKAISTEYENAIERLSYKLEELSRIAEKPSLTKAWKNFKSYVHEYNFFSAVVHYMKAFLILLKS